MHLEPIEHNGHNVAIVIRAALDPPDKTTFVTDHASRQQVGFIAYPAGGIIPNHIHLPVDRKIRGTTEVLLLVRGSCEATFFDIDKIQIGQTVLNSGDIIIISDCGHGFKMLEDSVFLEIKQGPYLGLAEKEKF